MRTLATIAAGLMLAALATTSAQAAPVLTSRTTRTEVSNDFYPKSARAVCPPHTVVYGGGADVTGLSPLVTDIFLRSATPYRAADGSSGFTATALNTRIPFGPGSHEWGLTVTVLCGPKLPGYEIDSSTSASDSSGTKSVSTRCSTGKVPLATGGTVRGEDPYERRVALLGTSVAGDPDHSRVSALAVETSTGDPARWDLIVTAVCATKPAGWTKLVKVGTIDTADYKGANTLSCPTGTQAYGGAGGVGSFIPGDAHLLQFATIRGTRWQSVTAAWSHPTKAWFATVAVFCAR